MSKNEGSAKPLIQEITPATAVSKGDSEAQVSEVKEQQPKPVEVAPFAWDSAPRIALDFQFTHMKDFVFLTFNLKGYKREEDVRYALSENEFLLEVRRGQSVARVCKTFYKEVDVAESEVNLLVDYIALKLKKQEKEHNWDQVGYDVANFSLPRRGQVKSNFITYTPPQPAPAQQPSAEDVIEDKENSNSTNLPADTA